MIMGFLYAYHFDPDIGQPCSCGAAVRAIQCFECLQYEALCAECWVKEHIHNPLHWAEVWKPEVGFFVRHDISMLDTPNCIIQLGHKGRACPNPVKSDGQMFIITHTNGIHATRVGFCGCNGLTRVDKVAQLAAARLLTPTVTDPQSACTLNVLRQHSVHHTQSKCSTYDFIHALRRLTDAVFTVYVPVSIVNTRAIYAVFRGLDRIRTKPFNESSGSLIT